MRKEIISLKKADIIFPDKITRLRTHDLISRCVTYRRSLTPTEKIRLEKLSLRIRNGESFGLNRDFLAIRKGRKVEFTPF
jgi:hypothetical protein